MVTHGDKPNNLFFGAMGLLKKISEQVEVESVSTLSPPAAPEEPREDPTSDRSAELLDGKLCDGCDDTHWWVAVGAKQPRRCWTCQPPPSLSLVACEYFFDDNGNRWNITKDTEGRKVWLKQK